MAFCWCGFLSELAQNVEAGEEEVPEDLDIELDNRALFSRALDLSGVEVSGLGNKFLVQTSLYSSPRDSFDVAKNLLFHHFSLSPTSQFDSGNLQHDCRFLKLSQRVIKLSTARLSSFSLDGSLGLHIIATASIAYVVLSNHNLGHHRLQERQSFNEAL
ncbi:MAG: hypothetical protein M1834_007154 [Cirrosporium novae-zelandiae]|nr:MAG: hypothetical protein M1834_007154 [Cirrosporium novae-zelandiae]